MNLLPLRDRDAWFRIPTRFPYLCLIAFSLVLWLPGFFSLPPSDRDESRFAQASKQMLETGDFVAIRFGTEARNRKPVGIHWLQAPFAAAARAAGVASENPVWPYRIPSALGGLAAVLLVFGLGRRLVGTEAAWLAAAMLAGCLLLVAETHFAKTDAALLGISTLALLLLARAYLDPAGFSAGPAALFWIALGGSILIKGPVTPMIAVLAAGSLVVADWRGRGTAWLRGLHAGWGVPLMLLVTLPWFLAIGIATAGKFFQDAIGGDLGSKLAGASEAHGGPPGFHLLAAPLLLFPATIPVFFGLQAAWRDRAAPATRFLLAWLIPAWIVFELVPTKLPHYVLPLYPALFLVAARWLLDPARREPPRWLRRVASGAFLVAGAIVGLGAFSLAIALPAGALWEHLLGVPALAAALLVLWLGWRAADFRRLGLALLAMPLLTYALLELEIPALRPLWITPRIAQVLDAHWPMGRPAGSFAAVGFAEPSLLFLCGTDTALFGNGEAGARFLAARPDGVVLVSDRQVARFRDAAARIGVTPRVLAEIAGINYSRGQWVGLTLFTR